MVRQNTDGQTAARVATLLQKCKRDAMAAAQAIAAESGDMGHVSCMLIAIDRCDRVLNERADDNEIHKKKARSSANPKKSRRHDAAASLDTEVDAEAIDDVHPKST